MVFVDVMKSKDILLLNPPGFFAKCKPILTSERCAFGKWKSKSKRWGWVDPTLDDLIRDRSIVTAWHPLARGTGSLELFLVLRFAFANNKTCPITTMSALKKRKLQHERSSFTTETSQAKPSKKTMDKIDDAPTKEPLAADLPVIAQLSKKSKKRTIEEAASSHVKSKKAKASVTQDKPDEESEEDDDDEEQGQEEDADEQVPATANDTANDTPKSFADLGIIEALCEACTAIGYKTPTPIQTESIPHALQGRDLIGLAETGSGKTAAFALPILQALMEAPSSFFGLVLAPTRELAYQISQQFELLGNLISVRSAVIVGGMDMVSQAIALGKKPHIIVATPGRLLDHLENTKGFSLRNLKYLVMDEADRLLDLDFGPILDKILKVLPRERRTYLFSATISSKVESLQRASLSNPMRVSISSSSYQTVSTLVQNYLFIPHKFKDMYLIYLLNDHAGQSTILFTRTVHETQRLAFLLRALGFGAIPLHGQLSQSARLGALSKFRAGSRNIMVATDVAARGLDIPSVDLVINFDLPPDSKTYVHRVGRTARAGKSGLALSVVTQYDVEIYQRIEKSLGKELDKYDPPRDEVMVFAEKVSEAQRVAIQELKNVKDKAGGRGDRGDRSERGARGGRGGGRGGRGGGRGGRRDGMDQDDG